MSGFENIQQPLPLPQLSAERIFRHPLICLTYTHLHSSHNCNRCTKNPIELGVVIANITPRTCPAARQPSSSTNQAPMLFQRHLRLLHRPPAQTISPNTASGFKRATTYTSHGCSAPLIPRQTASRLPLTSIFDPFSRLLHPTFCCDGFPLTLLRSLTGTYNGAPPATHALTPHFKGVSARGAGKGRKDL